MKGNAEFVKMLERWNGSAALYKLDPPMKYEEWRDNEQGEYAPQENETRYVAVSAVSVPFSGPETYIFPCDEDGEVTSWGELDGSFRGGLDHGQALAGAGYAAGPTNSK